MINNDKLLINFDIMKTLPEKKLKAVNILEALSESYFIGINDINDIDEEMIEILENIINGIDKDVSIYDLATTEILKDAFEALDTLDASEEDLF